MNKSTLIKNRYFLLLIALLFLAALACSESSSPELVATSESQQTNESEEVVNEDLEDEVVSEDSEVTSEVEDETSEDSQQTDETSSEEIEEETEEETEDVEDSVTESTTDIFAVGDVISSGDTILTVLGWEDVPGNDFTTPEEGNKFISVEAIIVNQSEETISISTIIQMQLKDGLNQVYDVDFLASTVIDSGGLDGELAAGESVRGKVGFQVPVESSDLQLTYTAGLFDTSKVFINLGSGPISLEPPSEIAGASEQEIFNLGEVISIGDSSVVVLGWQEPELDDFTTPEEGKRFIEVEVIIVNQSNTSANISSLLQMTLKDDLSQTYDVDFAAATLSKTGGVDGELVAGERVRGPVGFQVPIDATGLLFVFDADVFGFGKVNVALGDAPTKLEAPAEIQGELEIESLSVGDTVAIGSFNITVHDVTFTQEGGISQADAGYEFVVIDASFENIGSESEFLSTILQTAIKDQDGFVYEVDIFGTTGASPDSEIAVGETVRGQVAYQVPVDAEMLFFVFDSDVFDEGKVFYALP